MWRKLLDKLTCHKVCYGLLTGLAGAACVGVDPIALKYLVVLPYALLAIREH